MPNWFIDYVQSLTLGQIMSWFASITVVVCGLIEWNKKIPLHPFSKLFSWIGSCFTRSLNDKIDNLETQVKDTNTALTNFRSDVEQKFKDNERASDDKEMKRLRASIIMFSDSCSRHEHHTKVHFENMFRDIDDYNEYCKKHNFPNHFIDGEVAYIKSVFQKCLAEDRFIKGDKNERDS